MTFDDVCFYGNISSWHFLKGNAPNLLPCPTLAAIANWLWKWKMQWCEEISFWKLQCSLGKVVNWGKTSSAMLSAHMVVLKPFRITRKGNDRSPQLTMIISMKGLNALMKIIKLELLALTHHSFQPLPGKSLVEIRLNNREKCKMRYKMSDDKLQIG